MTPRALLARLLIGLALATPLFAAGQPASAQERWSPTTVSSATTGGHRGATPAAESQREGALPLSRRPAWTVLGVGIGQVHILFTGLLIATVFVATYRVSTRGSRYGR
jgi:hypothetical protein